MKYSLILVIILIGGFYYFNLDDNTDYENSDNSSNNNYQEKQILHKKRDNRKKVNIVKSKISNTNILFDLLKPPKNEDFKSVWSEEYGCYESQNDLIGNLETNTNGINIPQETCKYEFLNAGSFEEAMWMKDNGYPTKSMIDLVKNPDFKAQLAELVNNKYPVALAVASINAMENGNFKEASNLALSNRAYSNKSMIYPHILYGEALLADNMKIAAVSEFFVAGILGDPIAHGRALNLSPDNAFTASALSYAQNYLKNLYGLNVPNDPRPMGADGDG